MAFLFLENRRNGMDRQTDRHTDRRRERDGWTDRWTGATLNASP